METIGLILWGITSLLMGIQIMPACAELKNSERFFVIVLCLAGGPIIAAANIIEALLDLILPEGWNDDDFKGY